MVNHLSFWANIMEISKRILELFAVTKKKFVPIYPYMNKNFKAAFITVLELLFAISAFSQNDKTGTWNIVNIQYNHNKNWNFFFENQFRSQKLFDDFYYHELKVGVGYNASDKLALLAGNGLYQTYSIGGNFKSPVLTSEYRTWEQLTLTNNIGRLKLEHRYRIEQRWLSQGYRNRFRYRLNAIFPLNKPKLENCAFYANIFDEIFFTDKGPYFQRNRFFSGLGYKFSKNFILQIGYIRQFDYNPTGSSAKNFIQTALLFNIHSQRSNRELHPSSMD